MNLYLCFHFHQRSKKIPDIIQNDAKVLCLRVINLWCFKSSVISRNGTSCKEANFDWLPQSSWHDRYQCTLKFIASHAARVIFTAYHGKYSISQRLTKQKNLEGILISRLGTFSFLILRLKNEILPNVKKKLIQWDFWIHFLKYERMCYVNVPIMNTLAPLKVKKM